MKSKVKGVRLKGYLLDWAEDLESGDFSYHVKEALRMYLNGDRPVKHKLNIQNKDEKVSLNFKQVESKVDINDLESKLSNF